MKAYHVDGLDCAVCAGKLEREIGKIEGVKSVSIDFINQKMLFEVVDARKSGEIWARVIEVTQKFEPTVRYTRKIVENKGTHKSSGRDNTLVSARENSCCYHEASNLAVNEGETSVDLNQKRQHDQHEENLKTAEKSPFRESVWILFGALFLWVVGGVLEYLLPTLWWISLIPYAVGYLLVGGKVLYKACRNIGHGQIFDENFLMSIATLGAFVLGEFAEGVAVMLFYQLGELFSDIAVYRSRNSITALMDIRPDYARVIRSKTNLKKNESESQIIQIKPELVEIGELIQILSGERIPLDGVVVEGNSFVDTSALTGESVPRSVEEGDEVLSGCINGGGVLKVRVTKEYGESTVAKILELVENASSRKTQVEGFIARFSKWYTPIVVGFAVLLTVLPSMFGGDFIVWLSRSLVFLVVSCPCALVVSVPLSFFCAIGAASRQGVLVKGSNYLEALDKVKTVIFDKTGTITEGVFEVTKIKPYQISSNQLVALTACAESISSHPIAHAIQREFERLGDQEGTLALPVTNAVEKAGMGITCLVGQQSVAVGNSKLMESLGLVPEQVDEMGSVVYVAINGVYAGYILVADRIKADSYIAVRKLKEQGIRVIMLSGDSRQAANYVAKELELDEVYAELLPVDKVNKLEQIQGQLGADQKVAFVGDGINDAPSLARADVAVAMGGMGSDSAIEAADIVLMTDKPSQLVTAIALSHKTKRIVLENIVFALAVKMVILVLGALGYANMALAVFGDVGVTILAVLNSLRCLLRAKSN